MPAANPDQKQAAPAKSADNQSSKGGADSGAPSSEPDRLFDDSPAEPKTDPGHSETRLNVGAPLKSKVEKDEALNSGPEHERHMGQAVKAPLKAIINQTPLAPFTQLLPGQNSLDNARYEGSLSSHWPHSNYSADINNEHISISGGVALCAPQTLDQARSWPALAKEVSGQRRATWQYWQDNICKKFAEVRGSSPRSGNVNLHVAVKRSKNGGPDYAVVSINGEGTYGHDSPLGYAAREDIDRLSRKGVFNLPQGTLANEVHIVLSVSEVPLVRRGDAP